MLISGEDADKVESAGQAVDVEGIRLFSLPYTTHNLATAQVVDHDLLYLFGALNMEYARGRVRKHTGKYLVAGRDTHIVVHVFHT